MKTSYRHLALTAIFGFIASAASAQQLRSAYFSDSHLYRHEMNPAMGNEQSYFSIPGILGNMNLQMGSNFGVKNFIYDNPNKSNGHSLTTFMDENISAGEFLGDLKNVSKIQLSGDYNLFSMGVKTKKSYHTFEIGSHFNVGVSLPKDLFAFMKEMKSNKRYDFGDMNMNGRAYADISYGYSRDVVLGIRVGAKMKYLLGIANAQAEFTDCHAYLGDDQWTMSMRGQMDMALKGGYWKKGESLGGNRYEIDGYDVDKVNGPAGSGFALDLGATWDANELVKGLKVSMSLTDLGFINWNKNTTAKADGKPFSYDGFKEISTSKSNPNSLSNQWDDIADQLEDMYRLSTDGCTNTLKEKLGATFFTGVEYELPRYRKLSFGALYTHRFSDFYAFQETRLVVNFAPSRIFDLSLSGAINDFGPTFGGIISLCLPGLNLFVAGDVYTGSVNKNYIPLEAGNMNISVGFNLPLGFAD